MSGYARVKNNTVDSNSPILENWQYLWFIFILIVCAVVFRFSYTERFNDIKRPYELRQNAIVDKAALLINARLSLVETQIRLFKHELMLLNPSKDQLESVMSAMFALYLDTLQVRWIDLEGVEKVRLNKADDSHVQAVSTAKLQNKFQRYYTQAGLALNESAVFVSQIDLNVEQGVVQIPVQPTLRAVTRANLPSMGDGLLVINFDLRSLIGHVESLNQADIQLLIGAGEKRWMIHPDKSREWRPDLGKAPANILDDLPELYQSLNKEVPAQDIEINGQRYIAQRIQSPYSSEGSLQDIYVVTRTAPSVLSMIKNKAILHASLVAIATGLGGFIIFVLYFRHIHTVRKLNTALSKERDNIKQILERQSLLIDELAESKKLSSLSVMVAGLAHELNTPVGATYLALSNQSDLLAELVKRKAHGLTKSDFEDYIEQSQKSLIQAENNNLRAIELIKSFKRLTFERASDEQVCFSVAQHLNDLCKSMKGLLQKHNISLKKNIAEGMSLTGHAGAFSQIVQIFISNAIDHAFEGMAGACIEITCKSRDADVVIIVKDNGKGIEPEILPTIFDPFITSKRQHQHTGLGLHMAKIWIEQVFNGEIFVESIVGKGSRFELVFRSIQTSHLESQS